MAVDLNAIGDDADGNDDARLGGGPDPVKQTAGGLEVAQVLNRREGEDQVCRRLELEAVQVRGTCPQVRPDAGRDRAAAAPARD
ncbi:MAG: hypothetical protein ACRDP7_43470 [Trebonia sp.]